MPYRQPFFSFYYACVSQRRYTHLPDLCTCKACISISNWNSAYIWIIQSYSTYLHDSCFPPSKYNFQFLLSTATPYVKWIKEYFTMYIVAGYVHSIIWNYPVKVLTDLIWLLHFLITVFLHLHMTHHQVSWRWAFLLIYNNYIKRMFPTHVLHEQYVYISVTSNNPEHIMFNASICILEYCTSFCNYCI